MKFLEFPKHFEEKKLRQLFGVLTGVKVGG
jgi:hypothetical protein